MIIKHFQQTTMELPDAPLVWQAIRDAEGGPVDAAQILAKTFDYQACDGHRLAEKIAKEVSENCHDDIYFLIEFLEQLCSVYGYIISIAEAAFRAGLAEQDDQFQVGRRVGGPVLRGAPEGLHPTQQTNRR